MTADVVVVGGGLAGLTAASSAALAGARVIVLDKARAGTSGPTAFAAGDILCWLPEEDVLEEWVAAYLRVGAGLNSRAWLSRLFTANHRLVHQLDQAGFTFQKDGQGAFIRRSGRGPLVKCVLAPMYEFQEYHRRYCRRLGVTFLDRLAAQEILLQDSRPAGVAGFDVRSGEFRAISAGAVVLASGGCSFRGPFFGQDVAAGEGLRLALRAGARLAYLEYGNHYNVSLAAFDTYGQSKFMAHGGKYVNGLGQPLAHHGSSGNAIARAMVAEVQAGRGPIYMDLTAFQERDLVAKLMPTLVRLLDSSGLNFYGGRHEVIPAFTGTTNAAAAGVLIGADGASSVPGIFVAGDAAAKGLVVGGCIGITGISLAWALYTGQLAGTNAAAYSRENAPPAGAATGLKEAGPRLLAPLQRRPALVAREALIAIGTIMARVDVSLIRAEYRLAAALNEVRGLREQLLASGVSDPHELMIWHEALSAATVAEASLMSAQQRRESRGDFYREDYPTLDPDLETVLGAWLVDDKLKVGWLGRPDGGVASDHS